ncbi:MBL fold metallo-hydrolase [Antribacter gilvus]|uniref:MBL fold metallo-hydrolase n=1 Tax=Antribacter gilvus TaxID=2304675 RepID=UPI000F785E01|nr:MBL fold metallo-hydrolase [Antribacter gilvus]
MRLVTVGVSGSFPGPGSPASTYLLQVPADVAEAAGHEGRDWNVVLDLGNGGLGALQSLVDPLLLDAVGISHLHPDHCADLSGLFVYLRYHPERGSLRTGTGRRLPVFAPSGAAERVALAYGLSDGESMDADYDFRVWSPGSAVQVGPFTLEPYRVFHPVEAYGVRVTAPSSVSPGEHVTLAYTGDTDRCDGVVALARDVDLLLSESAFVEGRDDGVEPGIHLTGRRAGLVASDAGARRLLLTHLPVWNDPAASVAEAREVYDGHIDVATPGAVYLL